MNDLEELVREELAVSARAWTDRIDHDRVLTDGRRARRRRSLRRVGMGVVAAIAVLGWAGLAGQLGRGTPPAVVATPSPAPTEFVSNKATFDLSGGFAFTFHRLEVTVTTEEVWVTGMDDGGSVSFTTSVDRSLASRDGIDLDVGVPVVIGLLPGDARWITPVTTGEPTLSSDVQGLPAGGSVYLVAFGTGKASQLKGVCWGGSDGRVYESPGSSLEATDLDFDGHRGVFFFTDLGGVPELVFHSDEGNSFAFEGNGRYRPYFSSGSDSAGTRSMMVALLPWNATDPAVELADPAATWTPLDVAGRTVVVVSGTSDTMAGMVRSISYIDEVDGRVTQRVR